MSSAQPVLLTGTIDLTSTLPILEGRKISTPYGIAEAYRSSDCWVVMRHGKRGAVPPHKVNHAANIAAAKLLGNCILGLGSTGTLETDIPPGSLAVPDDIFHPAISDTICGELERLHVIPEFDGDMRALMLEQLQLASFHPVDGGVYAQTRGPRFETRAEIAWLADYAHFVGMTCASELTIACEMNIRYALLISVDNFANGIGSVNLTMDEFTKGVARNHSRVCQAVSAILPSLLIYAQMIGEN